MTVVLLAGCMLLAGAPSAGSAPADDVSELRDQLRALIVEGRHEEALRLAERIAALTEGEEFAETDHVAALNDLAKAQLRIGDMAAAEQSYLIALDELEQTQSLASKQFVVPLTGLAQVYAAQGSHTIAIGLYREALAISRRADGLFNLAQVPIIEALVGSYVAISDYEAAGDEHRYLVMVAEKSFGESDVRVIPSLRSLADWYERMEQYEEARFTHARIFLLATEFGETSSPDVIESLLGLGRNYRLQFIADPVSLAKRDPAMDQVTQVPTGAGFSILQTRDFEVSKLDRSGYRALERALTVLEQQQDPPSGLLTRTLIELGDWYVAGSQFERALQYYRRAHAVFDGPAGVGLANPLLEPRLVAYRAPAAAIRHRWLPPAETIDRKVTFTFTVTDKGDVRDLEQKPSDATSMQAFKLSQAVAGAKYSPRFELGAPVESRGVELTTHWFDLPASRADREDDPALSGG